MLKKILFILCLVSVVTFSTAIAALDEPIGRMFKEKSVVKVYIKDISNQSGQSQVTADIFKKTLEKSFAGRRSISFKIVDKAADSDIEMSAIIKNYQYLEKGPFKPNPGVGTMILEAAATMTQNYVEMAVDYAVTDAKSGKLLWTRTISDYIKKNMTPEESIEMICVANTKTFIWKCFGRPNLREYNQVM